MIITTGIHSPIDFVILKYVVATPLIYLTTCMTLIFYKCIQGRTKIKCSRNTTKRFNLEKKELRVKKLTTAVFKYLKT